MDEGRGAVLVVDDDPDVLRAVAAMVAFHGYRPVPVGDGADAVDAYRRHGPRVVAAVLDVRMPVLDGPGTLDALRSAGFDRPALFLSGSTERYSADDLRARGAVAVLAKPPTLGGLGLALAAAVGEVAPPPDWFAAAMGQTPHLPRTSAPLIVTDAESE